MYVWFLDRRKAFVLEYYIDDIPTISRRTKLALRRFFKPEMNLRVPIVSLAAMTKEDVASIAGVGSKGFREIEEALIEQGLGFSKKELSPVIDINKETPIDYCGLPSWIVVDCKNYVFVKGDPDGYYPRKIIRTVGDLCNLSDKQILGIPGIGRTALRKIREITNSVPDDKAQGAFKAEPVSTSIQGRIGE